MPVYEYRCRTCDTVFEARRPMSESSDPATCPDGHDGAVRSALGVRRRGSVHVRRAEWGRDAERRWLRAGLRLPPRLSGSDASGCGRQPA